MYVLHPVYIQQGRLFSRSSDVPSDAGAGPSLSVRRLPNRAGRAQAMDVQTNLPPAAAGGTQSPPAKRQRTRALTSPSRVLGNVFNDAPKLDAHTVLKTKGGITVYRTVEEADGKGKLEEMTDLLDGRRGAIFKSSYEYPGRYNRWSMGFVNPPIELSCNGKKFKVEALNARGDVLLAPIVAALAASPAVADISVSGRVANGAVAATTAGFAEEDRSRQPSIFSVIRVVVDLFFTSADSNLGLYGGFGYDLAFQVRRGFCCPPQQQHVLGVLLGVAPGGAGWRGWLAGWLARWLARSLARSLGGWLAGFCWLAG
eukprot:SAG22_NODE_249_length_13894_cov_60.455455_7_plen_314_part_00